MLQQALVQKIIPILERYNIGRAYVFGSVARGEETDTSDLDLLVELTTPMGLFAFSGLANEIEEKIGRPVDLATPNGLSKYIRDNVMLEAKIIYER